MNPTVTIMIAGAEIWQGELATLPRIGDMIQVPGKAYAVQVDYVKWAFPAGPPWHAPGVLVMAASDGGY